MQTLSSTGQDAVTERSAPDLTVSVDDVLRRRQLAQTHGPTRVQLLGRDADLRAEAELLAVDEARRRVHEHRRGVHFAREALRRGEVCRDDRLAVTGPEARDV